MSRGVYERTNEHRQRIKEGLSPLSVRIKLRNSAILRWRKSGEKTKMRNAAILRWSDLNARLEHGKKARQAWTEDKRLAHGKKLKQAWKRRHEAQEQSPKENEKL